MSMTEHERHELADIERHLTADAPRLARYLSRSLRALSRRRRTRAIRLGCLAIGVGVYLAGLQLGSAFGIALAMIGYVVGAVALVSALPPL